MQKTIFLRDKIYNVENLYWSIAEARFIPAPENVEDNPDIIKLEPSTRDYLRRTLDFYKLPVGPELLTQDELFARLREARDKRIAETDYLFMRDYPLEETRSAALLLYRQELRDLPAKAGAPWDGGGPATPWPAMPEV